MNRIEAILFDFGGTLDGDGVDWFTRFFAGIRQYDTDTANPQLVEYAKQASADITALPDVHSWSMHTTATRLCRRIHELAQDHSDTVLAWNPDDIADEFMTQASRSLQRSREVLASLRQHFRLGVVSNNWGNAQGWCDQFALSEYLDCVIDSAVVGAAKPAPEIFEAALAILELPPDVCVYVGDRYDSDVLGARNAGLTSVWVRPAQGTAGNGPADSSLIPEVDCITTLAKLLNLAWVPAAAALEPK